MSISMRFVLGATLLCCSVSAQAVPTPSDYLCGTGTITEVLEGAWGWEGIHVSVDWEGGGPDGALYPGRSGTVRVHGSDVSADQLKVLRAAIWLAFANDFRVKFVTAAKDSAQSVDCGRIREIHLMK